MKKFLLVCFCSFFCITTFAQAKTTATAEELQNLLYRYNPDVTWADYEDMINNYNFESRMESKQK